jgi:hypothetical protein
MFGKDPLSPVDYVGQKYQNYAMLRALARNNPQTFIGISPGKIDAANSVKKSKDLADFLFDTNNKCSGKLYVQTDSGIVEHEPG